MTQSGTVEYLPLRQALADPELAEDAILALTAAATSGPEMAECGLCHRQWDLGCEPAALAVLRPADGAAYVALLCLDCANVPRPRLAAMLAALFQDLLGDSGEVVRYSVVTHKEGHA